MGPQESCITTTSSSGSSSSCSAARTPDQIDQLLAGAGYSVRASELSQGAHRLEHLENVMEDHESLEIPEYLGRGVVLDSSDLSSWVDTLLSELNCQPVLPSSVLQDPNESSVAPTGWSDSATQPQQLQPEVLSHVLHAMDQEDSSIHLIHVLIACAECVQCGNFSLADTLIEELRALLTRVNTSSGIGKVASFFIEALSHRILMAQGLSSIDSSARENEIFYHCFYEAAPYLKFAHFTANQAILEAFHGQDCVHVIDFNLMQGLQWPALIQALALRPGGPPLLRITGIGPPSPDGRDCLREIGLKLAGLARSVNVKFAFRGVAASRLDDIKPWMLEAAPNEAIAVNSIFQLHKLLGPDPIHGGSSIESVLAWIRSLNPTIVTVVEQEANHNKVEFLERFTEALHYYSTMFDSLEACSAQPDKALAEMYMQREIGNVVCCEGSARLERHEPLAKWRARLSEAGFKALRLGSNAYKQASMLLTLFSAEGYCVEENEGCLTLGWHNRPLIAASAWQPLPDEPSPAI